MEELRAQSGGRYCNSLAGLIKYDELEEAKRITTMTQYDDVSFLRVLGILVAYEEFREKCGISFEEALSVAIECENSLMGLGEFSGDIYKFRKAHSLW